MLLYISNCKIYNNVYATLGDDMNGKKERFKRVATRRTNAVLKKLQILGHCANRSAYEYDAEEGKAIGSIMPDDYGEPEPQSDNPMKVGYIPPRA